MSLTRELSNRESPVHGFFVERFGNTVPLREAWHEGFDGVQTLEPPGPVHWSTIGTAIDYRLRLWRRYGRWEEEMWRRIEEAEDAGNTRKADGLYDELEKGHETSPLHESEEVEIDWYREELRARRSKSRMYRAASHRAQEIIELSGTS